MKTYKLIAVMMAVLAVSACNDELEGDKVIGLPGHFTFAVSDNHNWGENTITRSGVEAPILMETTLDGGTPLYLHTTIEVTPTVEMEQPYGNEDQPGTRGIRYTEDVFSLSSNGSPKISDFGVYGRTQDGSVTIFNFNQITPTTTETKDGVVYYNWNVKYDDTMYQQWGSRQTADFYGYAPYFDYPSTANQLNGNGLRMDIQTFDGKQVPILTYNVPNNVVDQKDILTAKEIGVSKSDATVVKLPFDHVMSAIKFSFKHGKAVSETQQTGYTLNNGVYTKEKDDFVWKYGDKTFNITVKAIHINNVYSKGTWRVGDNPYTTNPGPYTESDKEGRWIIDSNDQGDATFTYNLTKELENEAGTSAELTPDYDDTTTGHVFMMVPQIVPANATISLECEFTNTDNANDKRKATLSAPLKKWNFDNATHESTTLVTENNQTVPMEWLPGYTYTYTISMSDIEYVFDLNTDIVRTYDNDLINTSTHTGVPSEGVYEEGVFIRSYKIDAKGKKTNVDWEPQYDEEIEVLSSTGATTLTPVRKTGSNGWIHVYDRTGGTYTSANEVLDVHNGANENDVDNVKLFKIEVGSIMTPVKDLSLWNHYQNSLWSDGRSTANCYIVAGPGKYRIPLVYGNAITKGELKTNTYKTTNSSTTSHPILNTFFNYQNLPITSPYIVTDLKAMGHTATKACLVWEEGLVNSDGTYDSSLRTGTGGTTETSTGDRVIVDETLKDGETDDIKYIEFEIPATNFNYGNAVIGVCDETNAIAWSWHIWMTNPYSFLKDMKENRKITVEGHYVTFANTNIGWVDANQHVDEDDRDGEMFLKQKESGKEIKIKATQIVCPEFTTYLTNVLYQWGRKDPMRGNVDKNDTGDQGAPRGAKGYIPWKNVYADHTGLWTGTKMSIGDLIQNPNTIYGKSRGDLYTSVYLNLWATNVRQRYATNGGTWSFFGKTIYDPSPVGFCVPPSKYLMKLTRSKFVDAYDGNANPPYYYEYTDGLIFHSAGVRTTDAGSRNHTRGFKSPEPLNAANGFFHTATPYSKDENWQLRLYIYSGTDTHNFIRGDHENALAVKPVLWVGDAATEEQDPDPVVNQKEQFLTFTIQSGGHIYWNRDDNSTTAVSIDINVNETGWQTFTSTHQTIGNGTDLGNFNAGDVVKIRGNNNEYCNGKTVVGTIENYHYNYFVSEAEYEVSGNIMSMINSDPNVFSTMTSFPSGSTYNFCSLFYNNTKLLSIDNLVLPAESLTESCYESMFEGCTLISSTPMLPATTVANNCYKRMFYGCSELSTVYVKLNPNNATTYTDNWLNNVFEEGDFYCLPTSIWPSGASGIPTGWTTVAYPSE